MHMRQSPVYIATHQTLGLSPYTYHYVLEAEAFLAPGVCKHLPGGMMEGFEVVEPRCRHCGAELTCQRCDWADALRELRGEQVVVIAGADPPTAEQLQRLRSLQARIVQSLTTRNDTEAAIGRLLRELYP